MDAEIFGLVSIEDLLLLAIDIVYVAVGLVMLLVAKGFNDLITPYRIDEQLRDHDNPALGVALCGYFVGVICIYIGAVLGADILGVPTWGEFFKILGLDIAYALMGIVALAVCRVVVDKLILHKFSVEKEIIEDRNVGTGAIEAGALIASGLIIAGAIHGPGGGWDTALVFFLLGQAGLVGYSRIYDRMTAYDLHDEVECDNAAAGVACGASMIAMGLIVLNAINGPFVSWMVNLTDFVLYTVVGVIALMSLRKGIDWFFLPGASLDYEIAHDRNLSAAWIEATVSISVAAMVFAIL
tara:strand:+ start:201 stop:1091 length:891 start_codon:yes stop_codon:yes gene_type:complete